MDLIFIFMKLTFIYVFIFIGVLFIYIFTTFLSIFKTNSAVNLISEAHPCDIIFGAGTHSKSSFL